MPGKIVNRLAEIKERHEAKTGKKLSLEKIALDTGIAYTTIHRWYKNYLDRYDNDMMIKICDYFDVDLSDLIAYVKDKK